jgi:hypothetical protein
MGAPPYIAALGLLFGGAYLADRYKHRVWLISLQALMCITGLALVIPGPSDHVRFLGTFFAVMGAQCNTPAILAFQQNNVVGSSKRSVASAVNTGAGAIGGIIGRYAYRHVLLIKVQSSALKMPPIIDLGCMLLLGCSACCSSVHFSWLLSSGGGINMPTSITLQFKVCWDGGTHCNIFGSPTQCT